MSDRIMMALGDFRFEATGASYKTLTLSRAWRWPEQARIGREPAHQFTGREKNEIKLSGTLYPTFAGGLADLRALRDLGNTGEPQLLVDGLGRTWGSWVILSVNDNRSYLLDDGRPRKIGFDMTLREYGEDDIFDFSGWTPFSALISLTGLFEAGEIMETPPWIPPAESGGGGGGAAPGSDDEEREVPPIPTDIKDQLWAMLPTQPGDTRERPTGPTVTFRPCSGCEETTYIGNFDPGLLQYYPRAVENPGYTGVINSSYADSGLPYNSAGLWPLDPNAAKIEARGGIFVLADESCRHLPGPDRCTNRWMATNDIGNLRAFHSPADRITSYALSALTKYMLKQEDVAHFVEWVKDQATGGQ